MLEHNRAVLEVCPGCVRRSDHPTQTYLRVAIAKATTHAYRLFAENKSYFHIWVNQARNQLGTPGETKSVLRGAQIF